MKKVKTFENFSQWRNKALKNIIPLDLKKLKGFLGDVFLYNDSKLDFNVIETESGIDIILDKNNSYKNILSLIKKKELLLKNNTTISIVTGKTKKWRVQNINKYNYLIDPSFNHLNTYSYKNLELTEELLNDILFSINYINDEFPLNLKKILISYEIYSSTDIYAKVWSDLSLKVCKALYVFEEWFRFNLKNKEQDYPGENFGYPSSLSIKYKGDFNSIVISFKRTII